jgi:hypothetical protein
VQPLSKPRRFIADHCGGIAQILEIGGIGIGLLLEGGNEAMRRERVAAVAAR